MIYPIIAAVYLGIGLFRTQRKTVDGILSKQPSSSVNEPIWHAAFWPIGFVVSGK